MIEYSKNQNVVSADVQQDQFGLLNVSFVCEGRPEWPTALRGGNSSKGVPYTIYDDPLDAFRNGQGTVKYPPQYSYHRSNRQIQSWVCRSVLFADGSVYSPNEAERQITEADKMRVFSARVFDAENGLKCVEFRGVGLIGGKPIWPTALNDTKTLKDNPLDAFWGGADTVNLPYSIDITDSNIGAVWTARSYINSDGSPVSADAVNVVRSYCDVVNFEWPSCLDVDYAGGPFETVGATLKLKATFTEKLVPQSLLESNISIPYHVSHWAFFRIGGLSEESGMPYVDSKSVRGALAGSLSGVGSTYRGMTITNSVGNLNSTPGYSAFVSAMASGQIIDFSVRKAFTDVNGVNFYLTTSVFAKKE